MGAGFAFFTGMWPLQTDEGSDTICIYLIILGVILVGLYLGLCLYNKMLAGKRKKQHPCKYCGHMVDAVSHCCGAPVEERFMAGKCSTCGKECKIVCARCKRQLS
jgi:hypothetical protein